MGMKVWLGGWLVALACSMLATAATPLRIATGELPPYATAYWGKTAERVFPAGSGEYARLVNAIKCPGGWDARP
jgi:hypothetical protein